MHRPPFRADHIGSLLRPQALRQAYRAFNDRALDEAGFVAAQDAAIRDAIALQADAGLAVVTDGEFRRASYWSRFVERTEGLSVSESRFTFRDEQGSGAYLHRAAGDRQSGAAAADRARRVLLPSRQRQGAAESNPAGAVDHAFLARHRLCGSRRL